MRRRHPDAAEELDDMGHDGDGVRPKSKQGAGTLLPGSSAGIVLSLKKKHVTRLDWLAMEIRASGGIWITRSAIVTAFIEAALRSEPLWDVLTSQSRRGVRSSLMPRNTAQPEERHGRTGRRVLKMAKYLLRKRSRHFKREDGL
jgi:hypothetical protein